MVAAHELGPLEMQVLGLMSAREGQSVSLIRDRLRASGSKLAYTTVMTVLVRLHKKGLVHRARDGNRFLYTAAAQAPSVSRGILSRVRKALFRSDVARPILALIEREQISDAELRRLRAAIDQRLKKGRGR